MSALLRDASPALAAALASGQRLWSADIYVVTLVDGTTVLRWTTWDRDLTYSGDDYSSKAPWVNRSAWKVTNTMEVPTMQLRLMALNDGFAGGASIKSQIHQGLLDGSNVLMSRVYMTTPGGADALGAVDMFGGGVAGIDLDGITADIAIKGRVNDLDQYAPRNLVQVGCNHAFCDAGCTLNRATFTTGYTVGASSTSTFIPWSGSPPANATNYQGGNVAMTTGVASGARRTVAKADASGLTLSYPLYDVPAPGDGFDAFEACDKSFNSGSGQSCTDRSNTQHYRGFEFTPPPSAAF